MGLRKSFVAKDGYTLLVLDYKQLEMRIAAHLSGSRTFQSVFDTTRDPFVEIATLIFCDKAKEGTTIKITSEERAMAKQQVYAWLYGATNENFYSIFQGSENYHNRVKEEFRELGGVSTIGGHYRRCDGMTIAYNSKCQGSASDIFKYVLHNIYMKLSIEEPLCNIVLIVHDEIVLEVPTRDVQRINTIVKDEMINGGKYYKLNVPLDVSSKVGKTYGTLKEI